MTTTTAPERRSTTVARERQPATTRTGTPRMSAGKYQPYPTVDLPDRQWPGRTITRAPVWCSVDLRDGNQALINPMNGARKRRMLKALVELGFKEIEIGFPSASETDFGFTREAIEEGLIPDDVAIQVLTQSREPLIKRTVESLQGASRAIIHLYNSTSELQRRVVFGLDRKGIVDIAVTGAKLIADEMGKLDGTDVVLQYSPESFTGTELDFSLEICEAVMDVWQPTPERRMILNLPATVEMATPNVYADQIEWFSRNVKDRDSVILSVHPHNDRGTAVAATELAVMGGADRVEGTLFGNGERTGNVDIVTLALNLYTQGVDPELDLSDINRLIETVEYCNELPVHQRHPYAGELVYTAFSGSHQDAIKKGMAAIRQANTPLWEVPYLPIDPADVGRTYEAIIRINSQSGKSGIAYVLETDFGIRLPKPAQVEFSQMVQKITDETGKEITPEEIWRVFRTEYLERDEPFSLVDFVSMPVSRGSRLEKIEATVRHEGVDHQIEGTGNGPIEAFVRSFRPRFGLEFRVSDYHEYALSPGSDAQAVACIEVTPADRPPLYGVGIDQSITMASIKAVLSAVNRL